MELDTNALEDVRVHPSLGFYDLHSVSSSFAVEDSLQGLVCNVVQLLLCDGQPGDGLLVMLDEPQLVLDNVGDMSGHSDNLHLGVTDVDCSAVCLQLLGLILVTPYL